MGFVGLYACRVKRLRTEKRNAAIFVGFAPMFSALAFAYCGLSCCCFAPVVCWFRLGCGLCCWWFFFPSDDMTKRKGAISCVLSLFVGCCYSFANCSRASCHTFSASSGFSPQLFQCWRLAPKYRQSIALSFAASLAVSLFVRAILGAGFICSGLPLLHLLLTLRKSTQRRRLDAH